MTLKPVLGISFGYHDSSVCLVKNKKDIFAEHEERFTRIKFDSSFPLHSLNWILKNSESTSLDVFFYEDPTIKRIRLIKQMFTNFPEEKAKVIDKILLTSRSNFSNYISRQLSEVNKSSKIRFVRHHESHAAAGFFSSNFYESAILVVDGVGEIASTSIWHGNRNKIKLLEVERFPNSIGLMYAFFAAYCGFKINSGEYKFMGLAPYGSPIYKTIILNHFISMSKDGTYRIQAKKMGIANFNGFDFEYAEKLFQRKKRQPDETLDYFHACIAFSVQSILNDLMVNLARRALKITHSKNLVIGGGVGLNCVSNAKVAEAIGEEKIFIFSASGDSGGALGAATIGFIKINKTEIQDKPFRIDINQSKIGRSFLDSEIQIVLQNLCIPHSKISETIASKIVAEKLAEGSVVGIFSGPAEFGPRALGNRSILADARIKNGQIHINQKIKFRESFRPFAPIVLEEEAKKFFEISSPSPFMLRTVLVRNISSKFEIEEPMLTSSIDIEQSLNRISSPIPAVTHLDGSARIQTISKDDKSFTRKCLASFYKITGFPVLVNTSFNVRGEPMVSSPYDAINCFMTTGIDYLYIEGYFLDKKQMSEKLKNSFNLKIQED
jgi:carbamoyltransferase